MARVIDRRSAHLVDTTLSEIEGSQAPAVTQPRRQARLAFPGTPHGSWWVFIVSACAACGVLGAAVWMSTRLHPDPTMRNIALFVHLACLVLGFGAVLAADYFIVLWLARRATLAEAVHVTTRLHWPIWAGLLGLVISGTLLGPSLSAAMTQVKLVFVAVLILNGLQAAILSRRVKASTGTMGIRLLTWGAMTATLSQVCWWGSAWIGFWNAIHRH